MTSKKPYWFELSDGDQPISLPRKANRNTPLVAVVTAGFAILGGSLLLNTHDEPSANAAVSTIAITATPTSPTSNSTPQSEPRSPQKSPAIAPVSPDKTVISNSRGSDEGREYEGENNDD